MRFFIKSLVILVAVFSLSYSAIAQSLNSRNVGVSLLVDRDFNSRYSPSLGLVFEQKFTKSSGVEIGAFYKGRTYNLDLTYTTPDNITYLESAKLRTNFISLPVMYRYYTKFGNFSIGPKFDIYMGWNQIGTSEGTITDVALSPRIDIGPMAKVSKPFSLGEKLFIEPELRFGFMANSSVAFYGVGIQLKEKVR